MVYLRDYAPVLEGGPLPPPRVLARVETRCGGVSWGSGALALVHEAWYLTRRSKVGGWGVGYGRAGHTEVHTLQCRGSVVSVHFLGYMPSVCDNTKIAPLCVGIGNVGDRRAIVTGVWYLHCVVSCH